MPPGSVMFKRQLLNSGQITFETYTISPIVHKTHANGRHQLGLLCAFLNTTQPFCTPCTQIMHSVAMCQTCFGWSSRKMAHACDMAFLAHRWPN